MSPDTQEKVHNQGYLYEGLPFRLFNFSRLLGKYQIKGQRIEFRDGFIVYISSPVESLIQEISNNILTRPGQISNNPLELNSIEAIPYKASDAIRMLSPVLIAKNTFEKTEYISPWDENFNELININLKKKYYLTHKKEYSGQPVAITPFTPHKKHIQVVKYKNTTHTAWGGQYLISGGAELLEVAYNTGIGQKNAQGFGMFEFI